MVCGTVDHSLKLDIVIGFSGQIYLMISYLMPMSGSIIFGIDHICVTRMFYFERHILVVFYDCQLSLATYNILLNKTSYREYFFISVLVMFNFINGHRISYLI